MVPVHTLNSVQLCLNCAVKIKNGQIVRAQNSERQNRKIFLRGGCTPFPDPSHAVGLPPITRRLRHLTLGIGMV